MRIWCTGIDVDPFNRATWKDLRFDQKECVFSFYYQYGCKRGFSVRNNYKKPRRGLAAIKHYYLSYTCNKKGTREEDKRTKGKEVKHRAETRFGCKANLVAHFDLESGKYFIYKWHDEHNHELYAPEHAHLAASNRHISEGQSVLINMLLFCGVSIRQHMRR